MLATENANHSLTRCRLSRRDNRQGILKLLISRNMTRYNEKYQLLRVEKCSSVSLSRKSRSRKTVQVPSSTYLSIRTFTVVGREPAEIGSASPVNALPTHHRFIRTNGTVEFRRLVFGYSTCERSCLTIHKVVVGR